MPDTSHETRVPSVGGQIWKNKLTKLSEGIFPEIC